MHRIVAGAPIIDTESGKAVALVVLTFTAEDWEHRIAVYRWFSLATVVLFFLVVLGSTSRVYYFSRINRKLHDEILERKRIEKDLLQMATAVEHSPSIIFVTDRNGTIEYVNPKFVEITGYSEQEVIGGNPRILKSGARPKEDYEKLWQTILAGKEWHGEFTNKRKSGEEFWISASISPIFNENGEIINFVCVQEEITEQKKIQEKIEEAGKRFRTLFESSQDALLVLDEDEKIIQFNEAALKTYSCASKEDLLNHHPIEFCPPTQSDGRDSITAIQEYKQRVLEEESQYFEWQNKDMQGKLFPADVTLSRIDIGERVLILARVKDITERKAMEASLEEYGKNLETMVEERTVELFVAMEKAEAADKAKGDFLANVSHELRTPLNAIMGSNYFLKQSPLNEAQQGYLDDLEQASKNLQTIIENVLDFSSIETGDLAIKEEEFQLQEVLSNIANIVIPKAQAKGLAFEINDQTKLETSIISDSQRLEQVLLQLADNAIKFTEKGSVSIGAEIIEKMENNLVLGFSVKDTGIGLSEEQIEKLFQTFTQGDASSTRKFGGLGLGLSVSQQLVELLGGQLKVESEEGKGSTFSFTITAGIGKEQAEELTDEIPKKGKAETAITEQALELSPEEFEKGMKELARLLSLGDMDSETAFTGLRRNLETIMPDQAGDLHNQIQSYNFKKALEIVYTIADQVEINLERKGEE